ncbi:MAG: hypothetical protein RML33_10905, partial [Acidobacteriota bacterium]|nr:hypothetical protein [Acidobacteriota bacterium]
MRIGRLRKRLRRTSVEPEYYRDYTSFKVFGGKAEARIPPFDGKAFLDWCWYFQRDIIWHSHSVNGLIPAALIDYTLEWRKETKTNKEDWCFFTLFSWSYNNIIVNYTYSLEGEWIRDYKLFTVLKTTRMKVEFKAETREVLLPPGATIFLSPLT